MKFHMLLQYSLSVPNYTIPVPIRAGSSHDQLGDVFIYIPSLDSVIGMISSCLHIVAFFIIYTCPFATRQSAVFSKGSVLMKT